MSDDAWMDRAACKGRTDIDWHPGRGHNHAVQQARQICNTCPVRDDCLAYALARSYLDDVGIWGGTSSKQRRRMRHTSRLAAATGASA